MVRSHLILSSSAQTHQAEIRARVETIVSLLNMRISLAARSAALMKCSLTRIPNSVFRDLLLTFANSPSLQMKIGNDVRRRDCRAMVSHVIVSSLVVLTTHWEKVTSDITLRSMVAFAMFRSCEIFLQVQAEALGLSPWQMNQWLRDW